MEDLNMKKKIYSGIFMISLALSGAIKSGKTRRAD